MTENIQTHTEQRLLIFDPSTADQSAADTSPGEPGCNWCDSKLTSIDGVCDRCHALLVGAGLRDEEIFPLYGQDPEEDC